MPHAGMRCVCAQAYVSSFSFDLFGALRLCRGWEAAPLCSVGGKGGYACTRLRRALLECVNAYNIQAGARSFIVIVTTILASVYNSLRLARAAG